MSHVIGIDTSTSATKAIVIDEDGAVAGVGVSSYDFQTPQPLWSEQSPGVWWNATRAAIDSALGAAGADAADTRGIGVTGQMHGSVLLDERLEPVRPALLWNDQRTGVEAAEIAATIGLETLVEITGNASFTGFTAPKLLWVRRHEPENWARVRHVLLPKDQVRLRLTGSLATDPSDGSGTGLLDLRSRTWSGSVTAALEIDRALLPEVVEGPRVAGVVSSEAAQLTGIGEGTPVVGGAGDQAGNAVGDGAVRPGVVALSLGTSGVVFTTTEGPVVEPAGRVHAMCHAVPDRWHMMGVMLSAAGSLRWFRDALAPGIGFDELGTEASTAEPGAGGLMFAPYLTGERTPHADPYARGAFVGLTVRHERRDLTRAVMEGVAFGLADGLDLMNGAGVARPSQIRASGGGTDSPLWSQILADVLGAELVTVSTTEGAAYGAGILAAVGAGWFGTVDEAVGEWVTTRPLAEPSRLREFYRERHAAFKEIYPALSAIAPPWWS